MFGEVYSYNVMAKYTSYVGSLFSGIILPRYNSANVMVDQIKVPLQYASKEAAEARILADPNIDRPEGATTLPMISFENTGMTYDASRKLSTMQKIAFTAGGISSNGAPYQYMPVPYDMSFEVNVYAHYVEDGFRMLEQILPYFTPDWTNSLMLIPEMGIERDVPVVLRSVTPSDNFETSEQFTGRRYVVWTLDLLVKGWFFGPTRTQQLIETVIVNFEDFDVYANVIANTVANVVANASSGVVNVAGVVANTLTGLSNNVIETLVVYPGQDANGNPTTNTSIAVNPANVAPNSSFAYIDLVNQSAGGLPNTSLLL